MGYKIVHLANGSPALHSSDYGETMHPGLGPQAEAELLYVRQLNLVERMKGGAGESVIWDIGLGAAANAIAALRATANCSRPLRIVSFDNSAEPLEFALQNASMFGYLAGYVPQLRELLQNRCVKFQNGRQPVTWEFHLGDFPTWLAAGKTEPAPHAIFFDAFSPAKNPAMWTLPLFTDLFRVLDLVRPCALTTYSRSTILRVTLLLAGFFVGVGRATGMKEETTVAANTLDLLAQPLDRRWLERALRSGSAEPLRQPIYTQSPLSEATWKSLQAHPQFQT